MVVMLNPARTDGGKRLIEMVSPRKRNSPLISVITVVYNGAAELRATIESVLQQKRSDIEYIVVAVARLTAHATCCCASTASWTTGLASLTTVSMTL
jgi:hypothetical protein